MRELLDSIWNMPADSLANRVAGAMIGMSFATIIIIAAIGAVLGAATWREKQRYARRNKF